MITRKRKRALERRRADVKKYREMVASGETEFELDRVLVSLSVVKRKLRCAEAEVTTLEGRLS